jgi:hypothetical protein
MTPGRRSPTIHASVADLSAIHVTMDLETLGELTGAIAYDLARRKDFELTQDDLVESCRAAWRHVLHMHDRADFARAALADIAAIETLTE